MKALLSLGSIVVLLALSTVLVPARAEAKGGNGNRSSSYTGKGGNGNRPSSYTGKGGTGNRSSSYTGKGGTGQNKPHRHHNRNWHGWSSRVWAADWGTYLYYSPEDNCWYSYDENQQEYVACE